MPPQRYRAFISYSHADIELARDLHEWLESFEIPEGLDGAGNKLAPVFRDEGELSAGSLTPAIVAALEHADTLIVIASTASAKSAWVEREVAHFRRKNSAGRVLGIFASGFSHQSEHALPKGLLRRQSWLQRGRDAEAFIPGIDTHGREGAYLRLAAGISGLAFSELVNRHELRETRRRQHQRLAFARSHVAPFMRALSAGDTARTLEASIGMLENSSNPTFGNPDTLFDSARQLIHKMGFGQFVPGIRIARVAFTSDRRFALVITDDGVARLIDAQEARSVTDLHGHDRTITLAAFSSDGLRLLTADRYSVRLWDSSSGSCIASIQLDCTTSCAFNHDASLVALVAREGELHFYESTGAFFATASLPGAITCVSMRGRDEVLCGLGNGEVYFGRIESAGLNAVRVMAHTEPAIEVSLASNAPILAAAFEDGVVDIRRG